MDTFTGSIKVIWDGESVEVPDKVIHKELYAQWYTRTKRLKDREDRYFQASDKKKIDLLAPKVALSKYISDLPKSEQKKIIKLAEPFWSERGKINCLRRKLKGVDGEHHYEAESILEIRTAEIMDLFAKFYTESEVHKIVTVDWGYDVTLYAVKKFVIRYRDKIKEAQRKEEEYYGDVNIGVKRSRLSRLNYLLQDRLQIYDKGHHRDDSKEIRAILEAARKEVEGDSLRLDVNGQIDIELTLKTEKVEQVLNQITINQIILSRVAARTNIHPSFLISRLVNSYYKQFNGFTKNNDLDNSRPIYPSAIAYDFDSIQTNNILLSNKEEKHKQLPNIQEAVVVESVKERLMRAIREKVKLIENEENKQVR